MSPPSALAPDPAARGVRLVLCMAAALAADVALAQSAAAPREVRFPVGDSLAIVADIHPGRGGPAGPTILLFHQGAGNARGEYRSIVPRLVGEGYNVIAADVRGGGDRFGALNRVGIFGAGYPYCDVLPDVEAGVNLARAQGFAGPLVLWGSSYTATLVLQVAARRSAQVSAVLAFSPASGPLMRECEAAPYVSWLARAQVPTLVLRPRSEIEDSSRAAGFAAMRRDGAAVFVAEQGAHGSSMLDAERSKGDTEPQWNAVLGFLRQALEPRSFPATPGERAVSIPSEGGWTLRGDLHLPNRTPAPLVVLLHKAAGDRQIYRDLAARLAADGIGSLRVDLRGHGESLNQGRFVPGQTHEILKGTDRDVAAVWRFVRATPGVDTSRLGMVSGSYSSEAAAIAGREAGYGRAQVALSPGNFSEDSFHAAATSHAAWLFVRSDDERFVGDWLDRAIKELAPSAELWVVPAGSAHATDLLLADAEMPARLTEWLRRHLGS